MTSARNIISLGSNCEVTIAVETLIFQGKIENVCCPPHLFRYAAIPLKGILARLKTDISKLADGSIYDYQYKIFNKDEKFIDWRPSPSPENIQYLLGLLKTDSTNQLHLDVTAGDFWLHGTVGREDLLTSENGYGRLDTLGKTTHLAAKFIRLLRPSQDNIFVCKILKGEGDLADVCELYRCVQAYCSEDFVLGVIFEGEQEVGKTMLPPPDIDLVESANNLLIRHAKALTPHETANAIDKYTTLDVWEEFIASCLSRRNDWPIAPDQRILTPITPKQPLKKSSWPIFRRKPSNSQC